MSLRLLGSVLLLLFVAGLAGAAETRRHPALNRVTFRPAPRGTPVTLVRDGQPCATVVIAAAARADHTSIEWLAADEFITHVKLATGATLPLASDADATDGTLVLIGESRQTAARKITARDLPLEGFRVRTFPGGLAIVGRRPADGSHLGERGTIFGVYDVLERYLGIRWYYPGDDGRIIPPARDCTVAPVHYTDAPVRVKRTMWPWSAPGMDRSANFALHEMRYRGGESTPTSTACHTPPSFGIHFKEHPECFEMRANGDRDPNMPCYGNPETVTLMIQDLVNYYEKGDKRPWDRLDGHGLWGLPTATTVHVSPPDKGVECHCAYCTALMDPDAPALGRASRLLATYVARYAREVRARWPEKKVFYLPYSNYTLPPAGITFPDNVVTGICLMQGAANAKEPAVARNHDAMMAGWHRITGHKVHLWEYLVWPADDTALPFQYPHVLQAFQRAHRDDYEGTFINGDAGPPGLPGQQWAFQTPTLYCWFRLMWNPEFDVDAALREQVDLLYGPAAEPMGEMLQLLTDRWEQTRWKRAPSGHLVTPAQVNEETMPRAEAARLRALLDRARLFAPLESVYRRRVEFFGRAIELFLEESARFHNTESLPTLPVLKVGGNPVLDGALTDPCWRDAQAMSMQHATDREHPVPQHGTTVQAVWTDRGITLGFVLQEPMMDKLVATRTVHDQDVYWDDCVEIFFDVEGQRANYYQIVANSLGTIYDGSRATPNWDAPGVQAKATKATDRWTLEVYIPYSAFPERPAPKTGTIWYGNFMRMRLAGGDAELQRWSTLFRGSNHDFNAFGKIRFVE